MSLQSLKKKLEGRRVGLALGSGSARGWAHIGVLQYLTEAGIGIDAVAGTSMGALVGASFSLGKLRELEEFASHMDWAQIFSFLDVTFPVSGIIEGKKVSRFVKDHLRARITIEEMPIPFRAVAADLTTGKEVVLDEGDLVEAIRASVSIPGIFTPVKKGDSFLVDGGMINPIPVSVARQMGADFVIAVDLNHDLLGRVPGSRKPDTGKAPKLPRAGKDREALPVFLEELKERMSLANSQAMARVKHWMDRGSVPNIFEVIVGSVNIMQNQIGLVKMKADPPDLLIQPKLGHINFMEFNRSGEAIREGYREAQNCLGT